MPYLIVTLIASLVINYLGFRHVNSLGAALDEKSQQVIFLEEAAKETAKLVLSQSRENERLTKEYSEASNVLDTYRAREAVVLAKPGLVQLKLNKAYTKQQNTLSCITGGDTCVK